MEYEMIPNDKFIYTCDGELYGKCVKCKYFYPLHICFEKDMSQNDGVRYETCYYCRRGLIKGLINKQ